MQKVVYLSLDIDSFVLFIAAKKKIYAVYRNRARHDFLMIESSKLIGNIFKYFTELENNLWNKLPLMHPKPLCTANDDTLLVKVGVHPILSEILRDLRKG